VAVDANIFQVSTPPDKRMHCKKPPNLNF
jgi:hypothetical protein